MIFQTSEMNSGMFFSLSDETKIKMHQQQFCIPFEEWNEMNNWIDENIFGSYYIETDGGDSVRWILIYEETDAMAFKLKWM